MERPTKILQNGEEAQKQVNKEEQSRSKFSKAVLGRRKNENNNFTE